MAYADVSKPVVIQASKVLSAKVDYFLRRMCIVSEGGTSMRPGEWKEIPQDDIESILNTQQGSEEAVKDLKKKLRGFFAFAGRKNVAVLEVGLFNKDTNPISIQVDKLRSYIADAKLKSYIHYVPQRWYWPEIQTAQIENSEISLQTSLVALRPATPNDQSLPSGVTEPVTEKTLLIQTNIPDQNLTSELVAVTQGQNVADIVTWDASAKKLVAVGTGEAKLILKGRVNADEGNEAKVELKIKVGEWNKNLTLSSDEQTAERTPLVSRTENGSKPGVRDTSFSELAAEFLSMSNKTYFFVEMTKDEDPKVSEAFELYKNKKSVFCVYDNLSDNSPYPLASCILGLCASYRFDLSDTQSGTPLNFKTLDGQNYTALAYSLEQSLIQAPANYAGSLAGNCVVMNGRYADGTAWEYYYQWDFLEFEISLKLQTLLLRGVNSSNHVVQYNQTGLDVLKANLKSVLLLWQSRGIVTEFAASLDINTDELVDVGDISAIPFETYIKNNPEDYKNEIYKGFSFYVMIGRYPRQIFIEATLN